VTRHDLKEQLQHDVFKDRVSAAVGYAVSHRQNLVRLGILVVIVLVLAGGGFWFASYRKSLRQQDLQAAMEISEAQVGKTSEFTKTFPTQAAKDAAVRTAFSNMVAQHGGSEEGLIAQYYLGTWKAEKGDPKGAEADLKNVADSGGEFAPLAKVALAQLYVNQGRVSEAQALLRGLANKPSDLISKSQAQLLLAQLTVQKNPDEAKKILNSMKGPGQDPVVARAVDQLNGQLTR
jgi:predicted negative regulator of RcsB-dependent stress response